MTMNGLPGAGVTGLTNAEVLIRRQRGEGNDIRLTTSRTYTDILKTNVFNPVNVVLYAIGAGMVLVGDLRSAITTAVSYTHLDVYKRQINWSVFRIR